MINIIFETVLYMLIFAAIIFFTSSTLNKGNDRVSYGLNQISTTDNNLATAATLANINSSAEASMVVNDYQNISQTINAKKDNMHSVGGSIASLSMMSRLKNIINTITVETKNLMDTAFGNNNPHDQQKLDAIANDLDAQQKALIPSKPPAK